MPKAHQRLHLASTDAVSTLHAVDLAPGNLDCLFKPRPDDRLDQEMCGVPRMITSEGVRPR